MVSPIRWAVTDGVDPVTDSCGMGTSGAIPDGVAVTDPVGVLDRVWCLARSWHPRQLIIRTWDMCVCRGLRGLGAGSVTSSEFELVGVHG